MMALPLVVSQADGPVCRIENHIDVDSKKHLYGDSASYMQIEASICI
jgi:hypothetical protein